MMSLSKSKLRADFESLWASKIGSPLNFAVEFTQAYKAYASDGEVSNLSPVFTGAEEVAMILPILTLLDGSANSSSTPFIDMILGSISAFWLTPPIVFTGGVGASGLTSNVLGLPVSKTVLERFFTGINSVEDVIEAFTNEIHALTQTVFIVITDGGNVTFETLE